MIGRYMSDLETGDRLGPIEREITPFLVREYAHGAESTDERHLGVDDAVAQPTLYHAHKLGLLHHSCPGGSGPTARMHASYSAQHHAPLPVGAHVRISGEITARYERNGREFVDMTVEIADRDSGQPYATYVDTTLLSYRAGGGGHA
jgi:hypothetical protein